jgi:uncharacterized cupredoxin-like copper-binding protein
VAPSDPGEGELRSPVTRNRTYVLVAAIAAAAISVFVLAACGGDEDEETIAAPTTTTEGATGATGATGAAGKAQTVDVSETEFAIDPANPKVKAGTVTFDVTNDGQVVHNLEVEGNGVEEELEQDLQPGDSGKLTVDLQPGTYEWYCPVDEHAEQGMEGELTVE